MIILTLKQIKGHTGDFRTIEKQGDNMDFYCSGCDMIIREDDVTVEEEPSEAWGHTVYEKWYLCPRCGEPVERNYEEDKKIYEPMGRSYKPFF